MGLVSWLKGSFDNQPGGASSKKLSAFWALFIVATTITFTWLIWAFKHDDFSLAPTIIGLWLGFSASALGINAYEKVKGKANTEITP
jgi:hypothetical protein